MHILLNGEDRTVAEGITIHSLLEAEGIDPEARGNAVAVGSEVVPRGEWRRRALKEGEAVDVIRAVQGG